MVFFNFTLLVFVLLFNFIPRQSNASLNTDKTATEKSVNKNRDQELMKLLEKDAQLIYKREINVSSIFPKIPVEWIKEFSAWKPPLRMQKQFRNYLTGFDYDNQPIWIAEWGKNDMRSLLKGNVTKNLELYEKYSRWCFYAIALSTGIKSTTDYPVNRYLLILDFDGFKLEHGITNPQIIKFLLELCPKVHIFLEKTVSYIYAINVNSFAQVFVNLIKPLFGDMSDSFEIIGTNRRKWASKLLKNIPRDQLPPLYNGRNKNSKPFFLLENITKEPQH